MNTIKSSKGLYWYMINHGVQVTISPGDKKQQKEALKALMQLK